MSIDRLPEEILHMILMQVPADPDPRLLCMHLAPGKWEYQISFKCVSPKDVTRAGWLLRVSKRWYRVLVPSLYTCVVLTRANHTSEVAACLEREPALGRHIRSLWLQAGATKEWADIASRAPNVLTVYVNVDALVQESQEEVRRFFARLNPETAYLHHQDPRTWPLITSCIQEHWSRLRNVYLSDDIIGLSFVIETLRDIESMSLLEVADDRYPLAQALLVGSSIVVLSRPRRPPEQPHPLWHGLNNDTGAVRALKDGAQNPFLFGQDVLPQSFSALVDALQ